MKPYFEDKESGIKIYCGKNEEIIPKLDKEFDLSLTDPPYGIKILTNFKLGKRGKAQVDGKRFPPVYGNDQEFDVKAFIRLCRAKHHILWGSNHYAHNLPHNGRWLTWDKRVKIVPSRAQADCEFAWCSEYGAARTFYHLWDGFLKQSEKGIPRQHPTQKPIKLFEWCLGFYPNTEQMIDAFLGSGSSLVAAKRKGISAVGIDASEEYCRISAERVKNEPKPLI